MENYYLTDAEIIPQLAAANEENFRGACGNALWFGLPDEEPLSY